MAAEEILRRREDSCFSYIVIGANAAGALAPVVAAATRTVTRRGMALPEDQTVADPADRHRIGQLADDSVLPVGVLEGHEHPGAGRIADHLADVEPFACQLSGAGDVEGAEERRRRGRIDAPRPADGCSGPAESVRRAARTTGPGDPR